MRNCFTPFTQKLVIRVIHRWYGLFLALIMKTYHQCSAQHIHRRNKVSVKGGKKEAYLMLYLLHFLV
jgi:hypothetical protein